MEGPIENLDKILIAGITPYFLERENFWFSKNMNKILESRKTQSFWQDNTIYIERGQVFKFSLFIRKLDELGYEKSLRAREPGEFSRRGGIIEIFPVNMNRALRLDFYGNTLESIEKLPLEIKDEKAEKERLKRKLKSQKMFSDLKGLKPGDYLVHLDHGVARFSGIEKSGTLEAQNYYLLEYAQGDRLYVPFGLERKLSRYIGFTEPKISGLGSSLWQKTKRKIKEEAEKLAKELLEIYAAREISSRPPYSLSSELEKSLKDSFPYLETPDQEKAMEEIKGDLKKPEPMDRIVCGDVGFGKTEIALRSLVLAVDNGYQAVMICPSTILASQHYNNFKNRLENLPLKTELLSRFKSKKEQKEIIEKTREGKIDILIGTHRLLSKDLTFKNLGLLVIDDEQKFGVKQKEKLKKMRSSLDVLSLSATPIPRTLYLTFSSLKKISLIQTPPPGRLAIKTYISLWSEKIIKKAIESEISRGGQVYYLHNRVENIEKIGDFLEKLVRKAKISIAHGKLPEKKLIEAMADFQSGKSNVLLATTIIENGLDLPRVNALIVAEAARLGLSQAYQIRGRIGRSSSQAFAYFLHSDRLSEKAKMRLKALKEAEEIGSGYRIALRDLEIRGAGNILGKEQSGNINQVGLNLYCQMLSDSIEKLKTVRPAP
jgi:transcription-repair coupling factor (superfamily II helicase)